MTESLRLYPNNAKGHYTLALDLTELGRNSEAMAHYSEAARLRPRDAMMLLNFGALLAEQGQLDKAVERFEAALELEPGNAQAHLNLGNAFNQQGRVAEALKHYRTAVRLAPTWPDGLNRLACVLATDRDSRIRDGASAVRFAETANRLTERRQPVLLNTLAAAYAEAGRFDEAVATEQRALELASASNLKGLAPQIQTCLQLYQAGKPFHQTH
jgi:tetratricopeptide (TPR) repeat protein